MKFQQKFICAVLALILSSCQILEHQKSGNVIYSEQVSECNYQTVGTVLIRVEDQKVVAEVDPEIGNMHTISWPKTAASSRTIDGSKSYTLEYLRSRYYMSSKRYAAWERIELSKIMDGDQVIYDASICEIHHGQMNRMISENLYDYDPDQGVPLKDPDEHSTPNDGYHHVAVSSSSGLPSMTWRCPSCYRIATAKMREHQK